MVLEAALNDVGPAYVLILDAGEGEKVLPDRPARGADHGLGIRGFGQRMGVAIPHDPPATFLVFTGALTQ